MTQEWNGPGSGDAAAAGESPHAPEVDLETAGRLALRALPRPTMPAEVCLRIQAAISTEAEKRRLTVTRIGDGSGRPGRRGLARQSLRAFATGAVAAAAVTAVALVLVNQQVPSPTGSAPQLQAAVVAMNTSGTTYTGSNLAGQVGARWRSLRATRSHTAVPTVSAAVDTPPVVLDTPPDAPLAADLVSTSFARTAWEVSECLAKVAPGSRPVLIDLANFRGAAEPTASPAAVLAFAGPDTDTLDIYVVDPLCATDGTHARAHVTATPAP